MKTLSSFFWIILIGFSVGITSTLAANISWVSRFTIISPDSVIRGVPFDITVQAVDTNGNIVTDYSWDIIFNTDNIGDTIPSSGKPITFSQENKWSITFRWQTILKKIGSYAVYVGDTREDITGMQRVQVREGTSTCTVGAFNGSSSWTSSMTGACEDELLGPMQSPSNSLGIPLEASQVEAEMTAINTSMTQAASFESGLVTRVAELVPQYTIFTPWEIVHRTPMLAGFMWIGDIAQFITPAMFIGTPFADNRDYIGKSNPSAKELLADPTSYTECVQSESYYSFGLGDRVEKNDIDELRLIAKSCAQEFYGPYFEGKAYTTREEFLMMMFAMFEEPVSLQGDFTKDGKFISKIGASTDLWYMPFVNVAQDLSLFNKEDATWRVGERISDTEIVEAILQYTAYRMDYQGDTLDRGMIETKKMKFNLAFPDNEGLVIRVQ